jgi:hypothetical protein
MDRRKFLIGMGSLAAGGAAAMGTGATGVIQTNRDVEFDVAGDGGAYLRLDANTDSGFVKTSGGSEEISFDFAGNSEGAGGVNNNATTTARPAFTLENQNTKPMYVEVWNPYKNGDIDTDQENTRGQDFVTMPAGLDLQFIAVPKGKANDFGKNQAALIDRQDIKGDTPRNEDPSAGSTGDVASNVYIVGDPSTEKRYVESTVTFKPPARQGHLPLDPGQAVDVIVRLVADDVNVDSAELPSSGPVYIEAFTDQDQTTFPQIKSGSAKPGGVDLGIGL